MTAMRRSFLLVYIILMAVQMLLSDFVRISPYVTLTILPVMVLCIPVRTSPSLTMIIAFLTGLSVDFFSDGVLGLNSLALVPVAALRNPVIRLVMGNEILEKKEAFSVAKSGFGKISTAILMVQAVFLVIYILADGAGTRTIVFNALRFSLSLIAGYLLSLFVVGFLAPDDR